jgi:hypothetical protein
LKDLGSFVMIVMTSMETNDVDEMTLVIKSIATCSANLIAGLARIVAELDSRNNLADVFVTRSASSAHETSWSRICFEIILQQKDGMSVRWSPQKIECIERDFERGSIWCDVRQGLRDAYDRKPTLKQLLDQCRSTTACDENWSYVQQRFQHPKEFCGGLATAFPCTSSVKCDFSIVNWEKDDCRIALTDLSLESSIFHSKQFDKISSIAL